MQFFTNHIGQFNLVTGLVEHLHDKVRVVMITSGLHQRTPVGAVEFENPSVDTSYQQLAAYGQSKIANLLFAKELQRRFAGTEKTAYVVHPGVADTNLARHMGPVMSRVVRAVDPLFPKSVSEGAAIGVFAAVSPRALPLAGGYLVDLNVQAPRADLEDASLDMRLRAGSEKIVRTLEGLRCPMG